MMNKFFYKTATLLLTKQQQRNWGFPPDTQFRVKETPDGVFLYLCDPPLSKVYVEPTTRCNLDCAACMRHSWDEPGGTMPMNTFRKLIRDLKSFKILKNMAFWGIGEPLVHTGIVEMIQLAKKLGVQAEIITNGFYILQ